MSNTISRPFEARPFAQQDLPSAAGVRFSPRHAEAILADSYRIGFIELDVPSHLGGIGGPQPILSRLRENFPLAFHGTALSIGGHGPLDDERLQRLALLTERYQPSLVSDRLAWSCAEPSAVTDRLPVAYDRDRLNAVVEHIDTVQERLKRAILIENPSAAVAFETCTMRETDFMREVARRTGCGLLLDIDNLHIAARNHGYSASRYLADFPLDLVEEIHLTGMAPDSRGNRTVGTSNWDLFETVLTETGALPSRIGTVAR